MIKDNQNQDTMIHGNEMTARLTLNEIKFYKKTTRLASAPEAAGLDTERAHAQAAQPRVQLNYRRITNAMMGKTGLTEAYAFYSLALKSDYNTMVSNIKLKTLAEFFGLKDEDKMRAHINKLEQAGLIKVTPNRVRGQYGLFTRYCYHLHVGPTYSLVTSVLHDEPVKRELKGFLILLRHLCLAQTLECHYPQAEMARRMNIAPSTVSRRLTEAVRLGYVELTEKGVRLTRTDIFPPASYTKKNLDAALDHVTAQYMQDAEMSRFQQLDKEELTVIMT